MGILPFDDWFYHLKDRRQDVLNLHRDVMNVETEIFNREGDLRQHYHDVTLMTALNGVLMLTLQAVTLGDHDWQDLKNAAAAAQPTTSQPDSFSSDDIKNELIAVLGPAAAAQARQELLTWKVSTAVVKKILSKGFGKLTNQAITKAVSGFVTRLVGVEAEAAVEFTAGDATLLGIEASTWGTVAATGVGIVIGIGLDMIFDAINGAVERDELDKQISKLNDALTELKAFRDRQIAAAGEMAAAITEQRQSFADLLGPLIARDSPDFAITLSPNTADLDAVLDLQRGVARRYGQFYVLREAVHAARARNAAATGDKIIDSLLVGGPAGVTRAQLLWYWDVLGTADSAFASQRPTPPTDLFCSAVEVGVSGALVAAFRVGWITPQGASGLSAWSRRLLLGQTERFDLAALKVPALAQVRVEADPLGGHPLASLVTTRYDPASTRDATSRLTGSLVTAAIVLDDS